MKKFFFLLFISLFFLSCGDILSPAFDEPVRAYFEEYTNNAAIEKHTFPSGVVNPDGIICVTSESDGVISFEMRNPQKYLLNFNFDFSESGIKNSLTSPSDYSFTQTSDRMGGTLTFSRDFLNRVDSENISGKNISGLITIVEPKSGRSFKSYPINIHANTAPPSVLGAAFQRSSEGADAKYIVCFFMPDMSHTSMALHKNDTHVFYVNGEKKYIKGSQIYKTASVDETGNWTISDLDSDFLSSAPTMYSLTDETDAFTFDSSKCPDGYSPLYYKTEWPVSTETKTCTLTILDDDRLSSSVAISNKASQLNSPAFNVGNSNSYRANEDTGLYALKITHDGLCTDGSSSGSVTINYTIRETNGALVFNNGKASSITSSSAGSATIYLPQGTYSVTAAASKNYYITSEEVTETSVKITQSAVFYVSQNGSDSLNTGKKASPYRTIKKAISAFSAGLKSVLYESNAECIIYVMSDLTPPDDFTDKTFINIPNISNSIQIIGYGAVRTIDAKGNPSNSRRLLYASFISPSKFTIKNINLKGGYIDDESLSAAVYFNCNFEMIGGSITGCIAEGGNVIQVRDGKGLFDGVTISGNKVSAENNSVLYITDSLTLKNSSIINNTAENSAVKLSDYSYSLTVSGKVNIYNSKKPDGTAASNLYLPTGRVITVDGNISGSKIGVNVPWKPTDVGAPTVGVPAAFTSGYGYGTTNSNLPGEIFIAENSYGVSTDSYGEAAFEVSGGGMSVASLSEAPTSGTYSLSTLSELKKIRDWVSSNNTLQNVTFTLEDDIDTKDEELIIGYYKYDDSANCAFMGVFDGNNHTITNSISASSINTDAKVALFSYVKGSSTVIKNLTIKGTSTRGSIVGYLDEYATVENCISETVITTSSEEIGGIVCKLGKGYIKNCINKGAISASNIEGGILGYTNGGGGAIDRCINYGSISGKNAGGIVGYMQSKMPLTNCKNSGNIIGTGNEVGGIIGSLSTTPEMINNNCNLGEVNIGAGIIGGTNAPETIIKNNCNANTAEYGIIKYFKQYTVTLSAENNYSVKIDGKTLYPSSTGNGLFNPSTITESQIKSFELSEAGSVVESLNKWATTNSTTSLTYASWKLNTEGKPELDLGEMDNW